MDENLAHSLEIKIDLLQRRIVELNEQRAETERQIVNFKELLRNYRIVLEAEQGVGINQTVSAMQIIDSIVGDKTKKTTLGNRKKPHTLKWAIDQALAGSPEPMSTMEVAEFISQMYPEIANASRNLLHSIEAQIWRELKHHVYERVDKGRYKLKTRVGEQREENDQQ